MSAEHVDETNDAPPVMTLDGRAFRLRSSLPFGAIRVATRLQGVKREDHAALVEGLAKLASVIVVPEEREAAMDALDETDLLDAERAIADAMKVIAGVPSTPSSHSPATPTPERSNARVVRLWREPKTAHRGFGPYDEGLPSSTP